MAAAQSSERYGDDVPRSQPSDRPAAGQNARLAPGLELIGRYQGGGLEQPVYLARRADGQVVQMSGLLFAVARHLDGRRSLEEVAEEVGAELGRRLAPEDVGYLLDTKLRPAGLLATDAGEAPRLARRDPLLGLRFRAGVVPAGLVERATRLFVPLFAPPVVLAALAALAAFDAWLFFVHGLAQGVRQVLLQPELGLLLLLLLVLSTAFHELGHATACRYGGARPGQIGVGLYLAWPVFYSDVTDSYRLGRGGRLRTDLGGVYFNLLFALLAAAAYLASGFEPLLVLVALAHLEVLHQFFPFVRLDGYYVASDLIGVPDLFQRMRPTLASLLPGRPPHPQVRDLKPWARYAVAGWVLLTLATIAGLYAVLVFGLPRLLGTARVSLLEHGSAAALAVRAGRPGLAALAALELVLLLLPLAALALTLGRAARSLSLLGWRFSDGRPAVRFAAGMVAALALGFAAGAMWQSHRYEPIQPWERGTLPAAPAVRAAPDPGPAPVPAATPVWRAAPVGLPSGLATAAPAAPVPPPPSAAPTVQASPSPAVRPSPSPSPSSAPVASPTP